MPLRSMPMRTYCSAPGGGERGGRSCGGRVTREWCGRLCPPEPKRPPRRARRRQPLPVWGVFCEQQPSMARGGVFMGPPPPPLLMAPPPPPPPTHTPLALTHLHQATQGGAHQEVGEAALHIVGRAVPGHVQQAVGGAVVRVPARRRAGGRAQAWVSGRVSPGGGQGVEELFWGAGRRALQHARRIIEGLWPEGCAADVAAWGSAQGCRARGRRCVTHLPAAMLLVAANSSSASLGRRCSYAWNTCSKTWL